MRRLIAMIMVAAFALVAVPLATEKTALAATDYSTVRVLLSAGNVTTLNIAVRGNYFVQETGAAFSGGTLTVQRSGSSIVLSHSSAGQLYSGGSVNIIRESYAPAAGYLSMVVDGKTRSYLGNFLFKASGSAIRVVNTVPIQHYLYGVVAFEMSNVFPMEALKAQAVAAKCYVLSGMQPSSDYDIGDTASDQVYKGYNSSYTAVMSAVDQTYDSWLFLGNTILCSYFAASNGGRTILPSDTWAGTDRYIWDKAFARMEDPYDVANPLTVQETAFYPQNGDAGGMAPTLSNYLRNRSTQILAQQKGRQLSVIYINAVNSMEQLTEKTANISLTVTVQYGDGTQEVLTYAYTEDFAYLLANGVFTKPQTLRLYVVTPSNNGWEVRRGRYGHGVGLSQRGAEQMANVGMNYQQILQFYYPGAKLGALGLAMPTDPVNTAGAQQQQGSQTGSVIATAVTTGSVTFRAGPSTKTDKLGTVPKGTSLNVFAQQDGFSQVQYNNKTGYVSNTYLKITPVSSATQQQDTSSGGLSITAFGEVKSSTLNMRDKANTSGKVLAKLKKGDKLDIYGYADGSKTWYYCAYGTTQGYVSAEYITITGTPTQDTATQPNTAAQPAPTPSGITGTVNTDNIYIRSEASTASGRRVAGLRKGVPVTILGEEGEFYKVSVQGPNELFTGYLQKSYVDVLVTSPPPTSAATTGKTTSKVNLRSGPKTSGTKVLKVLSKGTSVTVLGTEKDFYHVDAGGTKGYVAKKYLKVS